MVKDLFFDSNLVSRDLNTLIEKCYNDKHGLYFCKREKVAKIYTPEEHQNLDKEISEKLFQEFLSVFAITEKDYFSIKKINFNINGQTRTLVGAFSNFKGTSVDVSIKFENNIK